MSTASELIILNYADYLRLRRDLKASGLDLCYTAHASRPVRVKWSQGLFQQEDFLHQVQQRRPADPTYCVASVVQIKRATWLQPDQFAIAFHSVGVQQVEAFQHYLTQHSIHSSTSASREMLVKA